MTMRREREEEKRERGDREQPGAARRHPFLNASSFKEEINFEREENKTSSQGERRCSIRLRSTKTQSFKAAAADSPL